MKRLFAYALLLMGIAISMSAILVVAQDDNVAPLLSEFAGTRECRDCHRGIANAHNMTAHALTMGAVQADADDSPIVADFSVGVDERTVSFEDGTRAFTIEDVAFTLGIGRNVQTYLYQADTGDYYVFPAGWHVSEQTWKPLELGGEWLSDAYNFGMNCASCHTVGLNTETYRWRENGVSCESCHGPGLDHVDAADEAGGSISPDELALIYATIDLAVDSQTCGQCHVRGLAEDGIHPYPVGYYPNYNQLGDVYTLFAPDDENHWWASGHARLPNMQYNEYLTSGHPNAYQNITEHPAYQATCLGCHSIAQTVIDIRLASRNVDTSTFDELAIASEVNLGVTCASCHAPHPGVPGEDEPPAPASQLRADTYTLCTTCHTNQSSEFIHHPVQQVFEGISLIEGFEAPASPHFTSEGGALCTTCHMPTVHTYNGDRQSHTFKIIAPGDVLELTDLQDTCSSCHTEGARQLQNLIDDIQDDTRTRITNVRDAINGNTPDWVMRALGIVEGEGSYGIHNYTYTNRLLQAVESQLGLTNR